MRTKLYVSTESMTLVDFNDIYLGLASVIITNQGAICHSDLDF